MSPPAKLAIVFGSYNRLPSLQKSVESIRRAVGSVPYDIIVVDGGSTDGSRAWLAEQLDVILIGQRGPLSGAVRAFNLGFGYAVDHGYEWICNHNDDAIFQGLDVIQNGVRVLESDSQIGAVAFEHNTWDRWGFDAAWGATYLNYGIVKTEIGMEVARRQGDPTGRKFWNTLYRTYAADTEFGIWLSKLGWTVKQLHGQRVELLPSEDGLRDGNRRIAAEDQEIYKARWRSAQMVQPARKAIPAGAKLHMGCGDKKLAGWVNADGRNTFATDVVVDFEDLKGLPDNHLSAIYWSHGPEHVPPDLLPGLVGHLHRALQVGGKLIIGTIDLEGIYQNRFLTQANGGAWNAALYGETNSTDHPYLSHRIAFTHDSLARLLRGARFSDTRRWAPEEYPEILALNDYAVSCRLVTCHVEGIK